MGYGEFGGNGSVHWRIGHEGREIGEAPKRRPGKREGHYVGRDPIPNNEVGITNGSKKAGYFRVDITYPDAAQAEAAARLIEVQGNSVVMYVKANTATPAPGAEAPTQVRVSW